MADDYVARYEHVSHQQLYDMLNAGDPDQVDALAASWSSLQTTANDLASALSTDLTSLSHTWEGPACQEFQLRLSAVSTFSTTLAGEFGDVERGLSLLSGPLRQAKSQAESPAETDDHDSLVSGVAHGAGAGSVLGPIGTIGGGIVGGIMGHNQDEEEKERAHRRMIALVAGLAVDYELTNTQRWPTDPVPPPADLPGGTSSSSVGTAAFSSSVSPQAVSGTGAGSYQTVTPGGTTTPAQAPPHGAAEPVPTSLLGTGDTVGVNSPGAGGLASAGSGTAGAGISPGALIAGAAALTGGGLAASIRGATPGSGGATGTGAGGGLLSGGKGPASFASDAIIGGRGDGDRSAAAGSRSNAGRVSAVGPGQAGRDDEPDERTTWLTEDDMDWGGGDAAPAVFGDPARPDATTPAERHQDADPDVEPGLVTPDASVAAR